MESDDDREANDAVYMKEVKHMTFDQRSKQSRETNGSLMSSDEAFIFFLKGPAIGRGDGPIDHQDRAHAVAAQQRFFCQEAIKKKYKEAVAEYDTLGGSDLSGARGKLEAKMEGLREALEAIGFKP